MKTTGKVGQTGEFTGHKAELTQWRPRVRWDKLGNLQVKSRTHPMKTTGKVGQTGEFTGQNRTHPMKTTGKVGQTGEFTGQKQNSPNEDHG